MALVYWLTFQEFMPFYGNSHFKKINSNIPHFIKWYDLVLFSISGRQYNIIVTNSFIGDITLPLAKSKDLIPATHALVFMLAGVCSRYKQIVTYHFSRNSVNALHFRDEIIGIVKMAWNNLV